MLKELIENYIPTTIQEIEDKKLFLKYLDTFDNLETRENQFAHFTSSAFIFNQDYTKVLMAYHNIFKSYSWLGGHLDENIDTLNVAINEAKEESSIKNLKLLTNEIISLDAISVKGHLKKDKWISPHIHLNVTYLFEANDKEFITFKEDENSSVKWISINELDKLINEDHMKVIYKKIISKGLNIIKKEVN